MMRPLLALVFVVGLGAALVADTARSDDSDPGAVAPDPGSLLAAAHARHADLVVHGLTSFKAKVTLRRADDPKTERVRDSVAFTYSYTAPDQETFDFGDTLDSVRKPLRDSLAGLWREVTGALWFSEFAAGQGLRVKPDEPGIVLAGTTAVTREFEATLATPAGPLASATFAADKATRTWTYDETPAGWVVRRREVALGGEVVYTTSYDVFRKVREVSLPTVLTFDVRGKRTEFHLEYVELNDRIAWAEDVDPAVVKAAVEAFAKGWKTLDADAKIQAIRDLAEFDSDLAAAAIAKAGLKDASADVREQAAEALGVMRLDTVVPALLSALAANEKEIRVYLRVIQALGEIGDPRAVDTLSKDWWNQRVPEYGVAAATAKIRALGRIRDAKSVEALLDTFTITSEDKIAPLKGEIVASLRALTGEDFLFDRRAWADWWKENRSKYRF